MRVEHIGLATLYLGDCREVLPTLAPCDLILTDPPYGLAEKLCGGTWGKAFKGEYEDWDAKPPSAWLFGLMQEKARNLIVWGGNYFPLPPTRGCLVWVKPDAVDTCSSIELAWTNMDMNGKHLIHTRNPDYLPKHHETQKPLKVMEWAISFAPKADSVCDPFMGSGTTGVAAVKMGRTFVGIEREPKYFEIACQRIEAAQRQASLFEAPAARAEQHDLAL